MKKNIKATRWAAMFFAILFLLISVCSAATYIVDPFFQFRVRDNTYLLNARYVCAGLIKNYDYDTLILGSSMIQNNTADVIRDELGGKPLNMGIGGMNTDLMLKLLELANDVGRAENYYLCIDLASFTNTDPTTNQTYLIKQDFLSKLKYVMSYEAWFRYTPVDIGLWAAKTAGIGLPQKFTDTMSVDTLEYWADDYVFGKEETIKNYKSKKYSVSEVDTENLDERMLKNVDSFVEAIDFSKGNYTFFFPPYSSLFWCNAQDRGYFDEYVQAKEYCIKLLCEKGGRVFDFQTNPITMDLENYKDTTHYRPEINNWVIKCMASDECQVEIDKASRQTELIKENTAKFREENAGLFS